MNYLHLVVVHATAWFSLAMANEVRLRGLPETGRQLLGWLGVATVLGVIMGLVTAHGHSHYLSYLKEGL